MTRRAPMRRARTATRGRRRRRLGIEKPEREIGARGDVPGRVGRGRFGLRAEQVRAPVPRPPVRRRLLVNRHRCVGRNLGHDRHHQLLASRRTQIERQAGEGGGASQERSRRQDNVLGRDGGMSRNDTDGPTADERHALRALAQTERRGAAARRPSHAAPARRREGVAIREANRIQEPVARPIARLEYGRRQLGEAVPRLVARQQLDVLNARSPLDVDHPLLPPQRVLRQRAEQVAVPLNPRS